MLGTCLKRLDCSGMFSIKFTGPVISSGIFSRSFLPVLAKKTTEKNMENFSGYPKYDTKHWTSCIKAKECPPDI